MKKILFFSFLFCLILGTKAFALQVQNLYSVTASTYTYQPVTTASNGYIKNITITTGVTAQNITLYKNATSTTTAKAVAIFNIPASTVVNVFPSVLTENQNFSCPYFGVQTSTSTNPANVTILYSN